MSAHAANSRAPAVLDGTCNTNVPTTVTVVVNGKEVVSERAVSDILKDQCVAVKKCMYSADDEAMEELKSLEAVACHSNMSAVTTKTPGQDVDKNYDGQRKAKFESRESESTVPQVITPTAISK